jgi:hypothetical protein
MIDITKITANPIPENLANLQKSNANLKAENSLLTQVITIAALGVVIYGIYRLAVYHHENQSKDDNSDSYKIKI